LRAFVTASKQNDDRLAASDKVHAISRSVVDAHLRNAFANWLHIAGIADLKTVDPSLNSRSRAGIAQIGEPAGEDFGLADFNHDYLYPKGYK
jgi:hypothetical protein